MPQNERRERLSTPEREVPIQVMVPESIRKQVAMMGASRGDNIRTTVKRGLRPIGIDVPESELVDRRGRGSSRARSPSMEGGNGAK